MTIFLIIYPIKVKIKMPTPKNVIVIGNCQARPVAKYMTEMSGGLFKVTPLIAHLSSLENESNDLSLLDTADIILTQPIADSFNATHLATSRLKEKYKYLITTWPNLFFNGQTPDIISLKNELGQIITGPLESYQSAGVLNCWKRGMSATEAVEYLESELPFTEATLRTTIDQSLKTLSQRECNIDVTISDFIVENMKYERLFFTFNHPTSRLIIELCERLCEQCRITVTKPLVSEFWEEPLGRFMAPTTKPMANFLGFKFPFTDSCKGVELNFENGKITYGKNIIYSFNDFVQTSYIALDYQLKKGQNLIYTPAYAASNFAI